MIDYFPNDPDKNELEWYLPSAYQALGIVASAGTIIYYNSLALALESDATTAPGWSFTYGTGWTSSNTSKNLSKAIRCVRDIPVPTERKTGTKVTTYTDGGDSYGMIDLTNLPYGIADRTTTEGKKELYEELDLYSYSTTGKEYNESNPTETDVSKSLNKKGFRVIKNYPMSSAITPETLVPSFSSRKFIVSPTDVYNDGDTRSNTSSDILQDINGKPRKNSITMTWAEANGRLNTANTQGWNIASKAMNTGCYAYKGKSGKDEFGSWRVPSDRELSMILIFAHELESEKYASKTDFQQLYKDTGTSFYQGYWSSTEQSSTTSQIYNATNGTIDINYGPTINPRATKSSTTANRLRCIKDIP